MVMPPVLRAPGAFHEGALVRRLPDGLESLASAAGGGGRARPGWVLNIRMLMAYSRTDLDVHVSEVADDEGLAGPGGRPERFGGPRSPWGSKIALATDDAVRGAVAT